MWWLLEDEVSKMEAMRVYGLGAKDLANLQPRTQYRIGCTAVLMYKLREVQKMSRERDRKNAAPQSLEEWAEETQKRRIRYLDNTKKNLERARERRQKKRSARMDELYRLTETAGVSINKDNRWNECLEGVRTPMALCMEEVETRFLKKYRRPKGCIAYRSAEARDEVFKRTGGRPAFWPWLEPKWVPERHFLYTPEFRAAVAEFVRCGHRIFPVDPATRLTLVRIVIEKLEPF